MLLERVSINGKPQGKCFAKKCEDCAFYRNWSVTEKVTNKKSFEKKCSLEAMFYAIPDLIGAVDGCQQAANETRNGVFAFGQASVKTLKHSAKTVPKLLK